MTAHSLATAAAAPRPEPALTAREQLYAALERWRPMLMHALTEELCQPAAARATGASDDELADLLHLLRDGQWLHRLDTAPSGSFAVLPRWRREAPLTRCTIAFLVLRCEPDVAAASLPLLSRLCAAAPAASVVRSRDPSTPGPAGQTGALR